MEAIFNDTLTVLTILSVVSVWGMVGAVVIMFLESEMPPIKAAPFTLIWPIVLVLVGISELTRWIKQQ